MKTTENRVVIKVDASVFERNVGDLVEKGETLGRFAGGTVEAPFNAVIESISFDADSHALVVTLVENRIVVKVDASVFERNAGDRVEKGETLGRFAGRAVKAPFNAIIESISFDADSHALVVTLVEEGQ